MLSQQNLSRDNLSREIGRKWHQSDPNVALEPRSCGGIPLFALIYIWTMIIQEDGCLWRRETLHEECQHVKELLVSPRLGDGDRSARVGSRVPPTDDFADSPEITRRSKVYIYIYIHTITATQVFKTTSPIVRKHISGGRLCTLIGVPWRGGQF